MTTTDGRARSRFLLEVALDQEQLKARIAAKLRADRVALRPPDGLPQLEYRDRFVLDGETISYRQYQRWEAAESMPEWKWMKVIASVLGLTQQELLAEEGEELAEEEVTVAEEDGDAERWRILDRRLHRMEEALGLVPGDPLVPPTRRAANGD